MSILINKDTRVLVQGITGSQGRFHTEQMLAYGTKIVGGVTPGKQGQTVSGVPVFDTVRDAVRETGADASVIYVPPRFAADSILEAYEAGIRLCVCITEGIPVLDMAKIMQLPGMQAAGGAATSSGRVASDGTASGGVASGAVASDGTAAGGAASGAVASGGTMPRSAARPRMRLIGPNCPGLITPGECKIGIIPGSICRRGSVGVISRSGTLTYEAIRQLCDLGYGQSTAVGIGGDPIRGTGFTDLLEMFENDPETEAIVMIGEIGGTGEEEAAAYIRDHVTKPVAAFIGGASAPKGRRMGHAGAIISGSSGTAQSKIEALREAGVIVADTPDRIGLAAQEAISKS